MLTFNRPSFKSGAMVVKATIDETELGWILRPTQKGTDVDFAVEGHETADIEEALLAKYPAFLTTPA